MKHDPLRKWAFYCWELTTLKLWFSGDGLTTPDRLVLRTPYIFRACAHGRHGRALSSHKRPITLKTIAAVLPYPFYLSKSFRKNDFHMTVHLPLDCPKGRIRFLLSALPGPSVGLTSPCKCQQLHAGFSSLAGLVGGWKNGRCMHAIDRDGEGDRGVENG